jgi:hypothetical protein
VAHVVVTVFQDKTAQLRDKDGPVAIGMTDLVEEAFKGVVNSGSMTTSSAVSRRLAVSASDSIFFVFVFIILFILSKKTNHKNVKTEMAK